MRYYCSLYPSIFILIITSLGRTESVCALSLLETNGKLTSLREFILALKCGDFSMRNRMSSRRSSTTVTRSGWKRMQSNLMADKSSGMLTNLFE